MTSVLPTLYLGSLFILHSNFRPVVRFTHKDVVVSGSSFQTDTLHLRQNTPDKEQVLKPFTSDIVECLVHTVARKGQHKCKSHNRTHEPQWKRSGVRVLTDRQRNSRISVDDIYKPSVFHLHLKLLNLSVCEEPNPAHFCCGVTSVVA